MSPFNSTQEMKDYFCQPKYEYLNDGYSLGKAMCPFPYVAKGWGGEGFDDVEIGDCSITYAESTGCQYTQMCILYAMLSFTPLCIIINYFFVFKQKRLGTKNKDTLSLAEKLCLYTIGAGICSVFHKIDIWGYAGTGGLAGYSAFAAGLGLCFPLLMCIVVSLVR